MEVTRRWFLGGLCASLPLAGVALSGRRFREAEYSIGFEGIPPIIVAAFTNGELEASFKGRLLTMTGDHHWRRFEGRVDDTLVNLVVRRPEPNALDVDSVALYQPQDGRVIKHAPWAPRGFIHQPVLAMKSIEKQSVQFGFRDFSSPGRPRGTHAP